MTEEKTTSGSAGYAGRLGRLIRLRTVSDYGEEPGFPELIAELEALFPALFAASEKESFGGSLLLRWHGENKNGGDPILLMNHHDVVEAEGQWTHPPFSGTAAEGKVWGRGTLDTKGGLFCMMQAAEELAADGFVPERDVYFVSSCNEETTGSGADAISAELEKRKIRFSLCLDEGGMIMYDPVGCTDGTFAMVGMGEKGCADLKFIARSNGGHASTPGKNTPIAALAAFVTEAERKKLFRAELSPTVCEMFRRMAPKMKGLLRFLCGHPRLFSPLLTAVVPGISPTTNAMFRTTVAFTTCRGSESLNAIPEEAYVTGNMRFSHHQGRESSIAEIRALADRFSLETEVLDPGFSSPVSSCSSEAFSLVSEAVEHVFPGVITAPYICNGASDARYFTRVCDNCLRFVPFTIDEKQLESIHGADENVDIAALGKAVEFYKYLICHIPA